MKRLLIFVCLIAFKAEAQNPSSFTPASFNDADRLERIQKAIPVIEKIYKDFALLSNGLYTDSR